MYGIQTFDLVTIGKKSDGQGGKKNAVSQFGKIKGFLDLSTGSNRNFTQLAVIEESTHVLIVPVYRSDISKDLKVKDGDRIFQITHIDDPVGVHHHLEIYLKLESGASA